MIGAGIARLGSTSGAHRGRQLPDRQFEHQMRGPHSDNTTDDLVTM